MDDRHAVNSGSATRRDLNGLVALGSALVWGAVAVSVWSLLERSYERHVRHAVSDKILSQVFERRAK